MSKTLSRNQRRELRKLASRLDRVLDTDRRFFKRFPDRQHRVRRLHSVEVRALELMGDAPVPPGHTYVAAIYCPRRGGARLRLCTAEPDRDEDACERLFEQLTRAAPETEMIRKAMRLLEEQGP
jgi:hypothetical protein